MPTTPVDIFWTFLVGSIGLIGMAWVVIAITIRNQRKQLEAERERREVMQHSAHKYADLFNNVSDIIFIHSLSGEIQQVNDAVTRELGYDIREIIGQTIHDFLPAQYNTRLDTYLERIQTLGGRQLLTARQGMISVYFHGDSPDFRVESWRQVSRRYWNRSDIPARADTSTEMSRPAALPP